MVATSQKSATPDWSAVRIAYIYSNKTLAQVAEEYKVSNAATEKRAEREGWRAQRLEVADRVEKAAATKLEADRAKELAQWNADDLRMARAIRGQVAAAINSAINNADPLTAGQLSALASAAEKAQKVGRLALGLNTDSHEHAGPNQGPIPVSNVPVDDYLKARAQVLSEF